MTDINPPSKLQPEAIREFTRASQSDWDGIVPLAELLDRINRVAVAMASGDDTSTAGRVKATFTERSFRHYQTLGCIDAPDKDGRLANYGYRHFVQALLVRRLLSERVPSEQIATLLAGRDTKELERMLRGGVEITARPSGGGGAEPSFSATDLMEAWNRARLAPGLELHFISKLPQLDRKDFQRLIARLKQILMKQGS